MKESELKTDRHNRLIQKSELDINRLYLPIQSEDRIGIGRSINQTFRPPLLLPNVPQTREVWARGGGWPEPEFVNVYGALESIPRNRFRQPM
jgi:hypothetical protein